MQPILRKYGRAKNKRPSTSVTNAVFRKKEGGRDRKRDRKRDREIDRDRETGRQADSDRET